MNNFVLNEMVFKNHVLEVKIFEKIDKKSVRKVLKKQYELQIYDLDEYLADKICVQITLDSKTIVGYIFLYKPYYLDGICKNGDYIMEYVIKYKYRGKGICKNALKLLFESEFSNLFGVKRYVAYINNANIASKKCAISNNMVKVYNYYIRDAKID